MSRMPYRVRLSRCTLECVVVESLVPRCPASGVFSLAPERLWLIEIAAATHGVDGAPGLGPWLPTGRVGRMKEWSMDWQQQTFKITTADGSEVVSGWVRGPFGIREVSRRWRSIWTVTHLSSGLGLTPGNGAGFSNIMLAQTFAERLLPLADWSAGRALADDHTVADQVVAIWNELIALDVMTTNVVSVAALAQPRRENRAARRKR